MLISARVPFTASTTLNSAKKRQRPAPRLSEERYAAKILFQFRLASDSRRSMRMVEERIVVLTAKSASDAYGKAVKRGRESQARLKNEDGSMVNFEFVGIVDLMHLGIESESDEVWYEIRRMKSPMERKGKIIPDKESLSAFQYEAKKNCL